MGYTFHTRTRGRSVTSVQHHTLPEMFCDFCTTFMPLPDSSVTSVTNLIPYRKYPYPTEHNLGIYQSFFHTLETRTTGSSKLSSALRSVLLASLRAPINIYIKTVWTLSQLTPISPCVCVCVCVCVFIKLHITAQPGPVKLIFQCYSNGSALWGISG